MSPDTPLVGRLDRRRIASAVGLCLLLAVVFLFVAAAVPQVVGADESYVVRSDSMSPAIGAGSVVFVGDVPAEEVAEGDVITFQRGASDPVTHRVVEVVERDGERQFRTQGDANDDPDPDLVAPSAVVGTVQFSVPLMGYVISFAQTRLGILALVVVPAALLVVSEIWDLYTAGDDGGPGGP